MSKRAVLYLGVPVLGVAAAVAAFVVGLRRGSPRVVDTVRRVNKATFNRQQMATAGRPGAYASVIRHRGRRSGAAYETPVGAVPTDDGFVIALPYGLRSDWLKNVLAAGSAELVHEGEVVAVDHPEVVPTEEVAHQFPAKEQRSLRTFRVEQALRLQRVGA